MLFIFETLVRIRFICSVYFGPHPKTAAKIKSKYTEVTIQMTGQLFENQKIMISALCLSLNSDIHSNIVLKYTSRFIISGYPLVLK